MTVNNNRDISSVPGFTPPLEEKKETKSSVGALQITKVIHGEGSIPGKIHSVSKESFAPVNEKETGSLKNVDKLASAVKGR